MAQADDPFADIGAKGEDPFADIGKPSAIAGTVLDVAKQIPSGLVAGVESIATFPAHAAGLLGGLAEKYIPGLAPSPEAAAKRKELLEAIKAQGGAGGIGQYLPKPETTVGQFARTGAEFVPATVAGATRLGIGRAAGVGATTGLTSEAAGQATEGTAYEAPARIAGALVGGAGATLKAERAAARAQVPTTAQTFEAGGQQYNQFRASGFELNPVAAPFYSLGLKQELQGSGLTSRTAKNTWDVLNDIEKTPFTNPTQLQERYKELGSVAKKAAADSEERMAAQMAKERLLSFAENPPAWMVQGGNPTEGLALLREANANWAAAERAKLLNQKIIKGELKAGSTYSGLNLENQLRQRIGVLGDPTAPPRGFSPAEQEAMRTFGEGTFRSNAPRWIKNLIGGGGGLGATVGALGGAGAGSYFGFDPATYGGGTLLAGLGLAKYGNARALARARDIERMLLERSPLAEQTMTPQVQRLLPLTATAPTLATLGERELY